MTFFPEILGFFESKVLFSKIVKNISYKDFISRFLEKYLSFYSLFSRLNRIYQISKENHLTKSLIM
jgi:hypothetical protein